MLTLKNRSGRQSSLPLSTLLIGTVFHIPFWRERTRAHVEAMPDGKEIVTPDTCRRRAGHKELQAWEMSLELWAGSQVQAMCRGR